MIPRFSARFGRPRVPGLCVGICVVLATIVAFGQANETVGLYEAMRDGKVLTTFSGTGNSTGDVIKVAVAKTAKARPGALTLTVPPGSILRSANANAQTMVVMGVRGRVRPRHRRKLLHPRVSNCPVERKTRHICPVRILRRV